MLDEPRCLLRTMFDAAVAAASPALRVPTYLPPRPRGRTVVVGAGTYACGAALREGFAAKGDTIIVAAGTPVGVSGTTNMLKVLNV